MSLALGFSIVAGIACAEDAGLASEKKPVKAAVQDKQPVFKPAASAGTFEAPDFQPVPVPSTSAEELEVQEPRETAPPPVTSNPPGCDCEAPLAADASSASSNNGNSDGKPAASSAAVPVSVDEQNSRELLLAAVKNMQAAGTASYLKNKKPVCATFSDTAARAVLKNLAVRYQTTTLERAREQITQANAAFDPVLSVSFSFFRTDSFGRDTIVTRTRPDFDKLEAQLGQVGQDLSVVGSVTINGQTIVTAPDVPLTRNTEAETVGSRARTDNEISTLSVSQRIPWGPQVSLSVQPMYTQNSDPKADLTIPGQRCWTTDYAVNVVVPVPFTKDFGPYGPDEAFIKQTRKARDVAYWQLQSQINSTLQSINETYWSLVRSVWRLQAVSSNVQNVGGILKQTEDLLRGSRVTEYELLQVKTEHSRVRGVEQSAWLDYVRASNSLKNQLDYDRDVVLLPAEYAERLGAPLDYNAQTALQTGVESNPDVRASQASLELSEIALKLARNQARPDLKIIAGTSLQQNESPFGYRSLNDSVSNIANADTASSYVGVNFKMPWGNKPALSRLTQSEELYVQAERSRQSVLNSVASRVNTALAGLASARERVELARRNLEISERIYATTVDLWGKGRVPALAANKSYPSFELMRKSSDLLDARFNAIDAQIDLKQSEARLLAAQGLLQAWYAGMLKINVKPVDAKPAQAGGSAGKTEKKGGAQ